MNAPMMTNPTGVRGVQYPTGAEGLKDLAALNQRFEATGELPEEAWHAWLWGTDPEETTAPEVLLNRNQLLGVLVCRYRYRKSLMQERDSKVPSCGRLTLMEKHPRYMTLRELKDTIANLQFEWPLFLERLKENRQAQGNLLAVVGLIEGCMERFGSFCDGWMGEDVLDDMADVQPDVLKRGLTLTARAIRRGVGTLLMLFRHVHLLSRCVKAGKGGRELVKLNAHHYEASTADFHTWYMHFQLPVGAKLCYKHDFPGMYNHVSQPVFFHNPVFTRIVRRPLEDEEAPAIHTLPSVFQIYPEIPVRFEEENVDVTRDNGWYWLLVSGRIYLITPGPHIVYAEDARDMIGVYVKWLETRNQAKKK